MKETAAPLFRAVNIHKSFSGNSVLKGISLNLHEGEVHALVGGNGAGKSTLMKIITGLYKLDEGTLEVSGKEVSFSSPADAHTHGIYLVPQEPLIFPNMTVQENILIGVPGKKKALIKKLRKPSVSFTGESIFKEVPHPFPLRSSSLLKFCED
ncbi:ATP-binding cassette domain-containing protein [Bacillus sp. P14.5]|uniref:ATP-binding cassette domain-containing protein n=1 Tax=Bacillus sp. P14.5 TaxID=1983400 RepID=UPI0013B067C7|nr:ATP-binding cassette domain-containing protein [Bacillus sp. P14.5]